MGEGDSGLNGVVEERWTEDQVGVGRAGSRLCGNEEVAGLYPGLEKDLLASLVLRHMSCSIEGSSLVNNQGSG